jgi:hypothetical protein
MAIQKQPGRATGKQPAARPSTSRMPAAKPATGRQRAPTGQHATQGRASGRVVPAKKGNMGLIIGAALGGVVVLILIVAIAMSGKKPTNDAPAASTPKEKTPVNVTELVESGMRKCEEGYSLIQGCKGDMGRDNLGAAEKASLKEKLQKGVKLIEVGSNYLDQASQKTGKTEGDFKNEWGQARKLANNYIANLGK